MTPADIRRVSQEQRALAMLVVELVRRFGLQMRVGTE